jgi:cellobiose phosphorylase
MAGDEPLRAELLNAEQLEERGRELATEHAAETSRSKQDFLLPRLAQNEEIIRDTCSVLAEAIKGGSKVTPAGEWLLDNLYLIDEQVRMARRHLPAKYSWQLPILVQGISEGLPRVYDMALNAISHGDGRFDEGSLRRFMLAYQETTPLTLGELWAIPIMLRLALIENLRRVAARVRSDRLDRDAATRWAEAMMEAIRYDPTDLILVAADMAREQPPMTASFVSELARRLQPLGEALSLPMTWINQRLAGSGLTSEQLVQNSQHELAIDQVSISNCIGSLRLLDSLDWKLFVEAVSDVERTLQRDPSGIHPRMDFSTRNAYRKVVEQLSRKSEIDELQVAEAVLALADEHAGPAAPDDPQAHVGYYLVDEGISLLERRLGIRPAWHRAAWAASGKLRFAWYLATVVALTSCLMVPPAMELASIWSPWWLAGLVLLCAAIAMSDVAISLVNRVSALMVAPRQLPRLDLRTGIPDEGRTLVVVPTLIASPDEAWRLADDLEVRYMANRDPNLRFALLTDFVDAPDETAPSDPLILEAALSAVRQLNERHPERPFFLLHRARRWNASERCWMGHERKRGKLADLNALLRGDAGGRFATTVGELDHLRGIRYVITLDTDTQLPRDSARALVSAMLHPLNHPRRRSADGCARAGYAILQPRVGNALSPEGASHYASLFGGDSGIDPYTRATSDTYQDLFDEGSFIGKGIYDVDTFAAALDERFPENRILSHDLLEGCIVRAGLATGIEVYEHYPQGYLVDSKRRHRWIRGDWQIAGWLLPRVPGPAGTVRNPLSALSRWKIFDNLRRSLVPVATVALLLIAWFASTSPAFWTVVVLEVLLLPVLFDTALALGRPFGEASFALHLRMAGADALRRIAQVTFSAACLPFESWQSLDAILRTLWRIHVSRRKLLEWTTSGSVERLDRNRLSTTFRAMWPAPVAALAIGCALLAYGTLPFAVAWLALWAGSPAFAWYLSRPPTRPDEVLDAGELAFARGVARRTWNFFDRFVGAEDHWLPPDNHQQQPIVRTAHRTSPTNIGMYLLAALAAHDLGYVSLGQLIERTRKTFDTMARLPRHRGHFLNWYDTTTLQPLAPAYVSTVDSGNLAAHLLTLRQGLLECIDAPIVDARWIDGLADTLAIARASAPGAESLWASFSIELESIDTPRECPPGAMRAALLRLRAALEPSVDESVPRAREWHDALRRQVDASMVDLVEFVPASLLSAAATGSVVYPSLRTVAQADSECRVAARAAIKAIEVLAAQCTEFARADFEFLYDSTRSLFTIGYNVDDRRADAGFYDLLASEARLGVFVAIAQGAVPQDAWFALGRLLTSEAGRQVLLSWSGSMFEYLMPQLVMPTFARTLIDETCRAAIDRQIAYARAQGVPWGISESGYSVTDAAQNYQYRAFGVPGLGLQRGLSQELVIAPYASALALPFAPRAALGNLREMASNGWLTECGYYEAIDFTPARLPHGETSAIVRSHMAHHQGMTLLAILQVVCDRPMQRRFRADAQLQATMLLLQERIPRAAIDWASDPAMVDIRSAEDAPQTAMRVFSQADLPRPAVQLMTNGRYHVMVSNAGGGYSRWQEIAVTRWQEDATRDATGVFCYLRDCDTGKVWSNTSQPTLTPVDFSETVFTESAVEFRRRLDEIEVQTQIVVSPEDDIELRRIRITNRARTVRTIEATSYAEIVLAPAIADALHPAFSNLFVETEILPDRDAVLATRRRASSDQPQHWMMHALSLHGADSLDTSFETDRMAFIGRGNALDRPAALRTAGPLQGNAGAVLDPMAAIRHAVALAPDQTAVLDLVLGVAATREQCLALVDKYRDRHLADRAIDIAWTHSRIVLGQINISEIEAQTYGRLAGALLYADPARRISASTIAANRLAQPGLWPFAISGDHPIVLLQMSGAQNLGLVRQLAGAHAYCRAKGLTFDLVIWNDERIGYRHALNDEILSILTTGPDSAMLERPGGVFVRSIDQLNHEDRVLMQAVARAVFNDANGSLAEQLANDRTLATEIAVPRLVPARSRDDTATSTEIPTPATMLDNRLGGFSADGREYVIRIDGSRRTPLPWVNVIANPRFGSVVSEAGSAYTWMDNAHEYRLSPWSNDPVCDAGGEAFYIRDEESGHFWSPTPSPAGGNGAYVVRHGFGYSIFEHVEHGLSSHLRVHVDPDAPVKFFMLRVRNQSGRPRRLSITGYVEWVLGDLREKTAMHVVTELDASGALLARNAYSIEYPDYVAFFDVENPQRTLSGDRTEFIGRNGSLRNPAAMGRQTLGGRLGASMDPCGAIQFPLELVDGETRDFIFRLGAGSDKAEAVALIRRFRRNGTARASLDASHARWRRLLGAVQVRTPDPTLDVLANGWLLYQVISCRLWGRSGFYQSGGAFGFRDQLQDAMAVVHADPDLLRNQILLCASRQFVEGDVQHWWHPPAGRGVRTRCSDDYLWLPLAVARYVESTGDTAILDQSIGFLDGRRLNDGEESYYDMPLRSSLSADLYEHCRRAIRHALPTGVHGLPLIGCGDWNDGMNNVGRLGKGESVWLGFFLHEVLEKFRSVSDLRSDHAFSQQCGQHAEQLAEAIEKNAWDGEWYLRAYFDDGTPLGSARNAECRIDAISQSWATLSGVGSEERVAKALDALDEHLVDERSGLIRLLEPPFDVSEPDPGYIRGYLPGVRENGGQYTHAAIWTVMAFMQAGRTDRAWQLFDLINPVRHGMSASTIGTWRVEPYVAVADVLSIDPHQGRGGWSWYTGSAGWMYRLILESMLGIRLEGSRLRIEPRIPSHWNGFSVTYTHGDARYEIEVERSTGMHGDLEQEQSISLADIDGPGEAGQIFQSNDHRISVRRLDP